MSPRSAGKARAWAPTVLLLLALAALVNLDSFLERGLGRTPSASVFELGRPGIAQDGGLEREAVGARRSKILHVLGMLTDPRNELGLGPEDRQAAQEHLRRLSGLTRRLLWLQCRVVDETTPEDVSRHLGFMQDPLAHMLLDNAWAPLELEIDRLHPDGLAATVGDPPPGWSPTSDAAALGRWRAVFGDPRYDIGGDAFLERRVVHLVTLHVSNQAVAPSESTERLLGATVRIAGLTAGAFKEWSALYRLALAASPRKVRSLPVGALDEPFDRFAARLESWERPLAGR